MNPARKAVIGAALLGATLTGGAIGASLVNGVASAQTDSGSSATAPADPSTGTQAPPPQHDPRQGGHQANGITETLLTGDTATSVTNAAQTAVPDGTIERVENDAEGATYEAHVVKADGTHVTVKINEDFSVASVDTDPAGGPGGHGHGGPRPNDNDADDAPAATSSSSSSTSS